MFQDATVFNQAVSDWDTDSVTSMYSMFREARAFNKDISPWDVSSVTRMDYMFYNADAFNNGGQALDWGNDTTNVTHMTQMFQARAQVFNVAINDWDTDSVTNMSSLFDQAPAFNQDIGNWDVSSATSFSKMFYYAAAYNNGGQPLDWGNNTSNVTSFSYMFRNSIFNQDILVIGVTVL